MAIPPDDVPELLAELEALDGVEEAVVLSTCNRVEVYTRGEADAASAIRGLLMGRAGHQGPAVAEHLFTHHGEAALHHLFQVATGLDSMILGEPQILGQLKSAYHEARAAGRVSGELARAMERSFAIARRARSESGLGRGAVSMGAVAAELAGQVFGGLEDRTVMLVGAGKIGGLVAKHLKDRAGAARVLILNRSIERAERLAADVGAEARPASDLEPLLDQADVVVTSTNSREHLLDAKTMKKVMRRRRGRSILLIDLSVPRNLDPDINRLDNVYLFDTDDMQQVVDEGRAEREERAVVARKLVDDAAHRYFTRLRQQEVTPVIVALRQKCLAVAEAEASRTLARLQGEPGEATRKAVTSMANAIVNKILHEPLTQLKNAHPEDDGQLLSAAQRLFAIDGDDEDDDSATRTG